MTREQLQNCSLEIQALVKFYGGRKLISISNIIEFSDAYNRLKNHLKEYPVRGLEIK